MGLLDRIFPSRRGDPRAMTTIQMINGYSPVFTSRGGSIYEAELIRACIESFARHVSKLNPEIVGVDSHPLATALQTQPNPWQTTSQFLARTATIAQAETTAFIVPITDAAGRRVVGLYSLIPSRAEIVEHTGDRALWLRYTWADGTTSAIELDRVGILPLWQYRDDFFGSGHAALQGTLDLMHTQEQGLQHGIKNSARIRFIARLVSSLKGEDISKERKRFTDENLSIENDSGVIMVDNKYADVQQVKVDPYLIDDKQSAQIQNRVYSYFGTNEAILQNRYDESAWDAYYEGKVEPFATDLSQVVTNMMFNERERQRGAKVIFTSSRLQYASLKTKIQFTQMMSDRGRLNGDEVRAVFGYGPMPDGLGEAYYIRGEYINVAYLDEYKKPVQDEPKEQD